MAKTHTKILHAWMKSKFDNLDEVEIIFKRQSGANARIFMKKYYTSLFAIIMLIVVTAVALQKSCSDDIWKWDLISMEMSSL